MQIITIRSIVIVKKSNDNVLHKCIINLTSIASVECGMLELLFR